jgi:hypothetical protein
MPKTTIAHPRRSISASTKKKREELLAETLSPLPVQSRGRRRARGAYFPYASTIDAGIAKGSAERR